MRRSRIATPHGPDTTNEAVSSRTPPTTSPPPPRPHPCHPAQRAAATKVTHSAPEPPFPPPQTHPQDSLPLTITHFNAVNRQQLATPIGQAGAGAALFLTGLLLSAQKVSFGPNVAYGIVAKNGLMPLFVWGLCLLLGLDRLSTTEAVLLTAIPCGFFGLVFGAPFGVQSRVAGSTLMLSTVAGIALLPQHV
ncbi:AEC family transporter [Streptomyces sp. NPDC056653]|uniref:AEC family transporter n=1 Tax=Streptomyces sp. NPDC056653 TaxID=3345894 RepID=UPI0036B9EA0D